MPTSGCAKHGTQPVEILMWLEFGLKFKGLELGMSDLGNEYLTLRDMANTSNDVA